MLIELPELRWVLLPPYILALSHPANSTIPAFRHHGLPNAKISTETGFNPSDEALSIILPG